MERTVSLISVVVPVYKEEGNIGPFLERVVSVLERVASDYEIIFCLDPCPDRTEEIILEHREKNQRVKLLRFSRRVGQPMATLAGLSYSCGDVVVPIDVDLQDPPELIEQMVAKWSEGYDVVIPQRVSRTGETVVKKVVSHVGYRVINRIADVEIPPNTGDFRLLSRRVVKELVRLRECHGFLRGMVALVGFKQITIPFERPPRHAGMGNYNRFLGSLRIGFNGIFCFSNYALGLSTWLGFLTAGFSLLLTAIYFVLKLLGREILWGNPTTVILITFLGGVQLITTGILGEYIGRIYEEVKQRPKFIVDRAEGVQQQTMDPQ
ncbi:glycosyltransferase family 2 protein [Roseimicrobium sp. ORNL1]|uniref:glycosyltransferase family 2 protein n=1 Tax=Roseimicrobium sp. ORNL1 TaxID=2711231 RepID=UPI0013E14864|nr:glycosyltransferase family 2 protein [Roseimicrobium sp. ORNL1]QIF00122.1 glycosyltransferase family 2 protein [Roseimicrobium sp. ORNL1]